MSRKRYLDAQQLLEDSWLLGARVLASGFKPAFIVAIWRGGVPIGIAVQEYLGLQGVKANHIAIRTASYSGIDGRSDQVQVYSMNYLVKHARQEDALLIVDDVFDTGRSIAAVIDHLSTKARRNTPSDIRVAVPYYKPARNLTERVPDYFVHETDEWLKFPHSLEGLSRAEIARHRPRLAAILDTAKLPGPDGPT
ncbi:MAG TPA: hypoxanthine phosphoribosyltransferase [Gammaproteobacteria bacterium]|nr:hypoxanthine phosphoribosyltransferase [Gammaproteobacteria bacterium]HIK69892.1 hypoxanthine phosphoribosyltransferase [Pseudomonadales bacterium]